MDTVLAVVVWLWISNLAVLLGRSASRSASSD